MATQYRNFVFTSYNVSDEFKSLIKNMTVKYIVYGNEICPTTKKKHLQGYCELETRRTLKSIKKMFLSNELHVEKRKGTSTQASVYCKKDGDYFEKGIMSAPGKRNDLNSVKEQIKDGSNLREIIETASSFQSIRMAEKCLVYFEAKRNWQPEVYWYYGDTGTGKTRSAMEQCKDPWISSDSLKWFQGYDGHSDVIFDDFRGDFCKFHTLLRLLDRYPYQIECKGGSRQFLAKRIFITSPVHPNLIYNTMENQKQLTRRITEIKMFTTLTTQQDALQKTLSQTNSQDT